MTTLFHYSKVAVPSVYSVDQRGDGPGVYKPRGLWLSVEDNQLPEDERNSWADWCAAEDFGIGHLRHAVTLADEANVLWLRNPIDIDIFTAEWSLDPPRAYAHREIRWAAVASKYQGIIIAPYQWSRRMTDHTFWYYGWDCASGCIWDAAAIESIEVVS